MLLNEVIGRLFYHGSYERLPPGTILQPQENYEKTWGHVDFYQLLEKYRPAGMLAHRESVFMCDSPDDVDFAGGATEWLLTVRPLGRIERHDLNWGSEISVLMDQPDNATAIEEAARKYWSGIPHRNESVWEYLTPAAEVVAVEEF